MEKRRVEFDGKWVEVDRDDGWGDPPIWYLTFSDGSKQVINYVPEDTQLGVVKRLMRLNDNGSLDSYIVELYETDWKSVGREDDVELSILRFFNYDKLSQDKDYFRLSTLNRLIVRAASRFANGQEIEYNYVSERSFIELVDFKENFDFDFNTLTDTITKLTQEFNSIQERVLFTDRIFAGEQVGLGWSNESFFSQYGDTEEAKTMLSLVGQ